MPRLQSQTQKMDQLFAHSLDSLLAEYPESHQQRLRTYWDRFSQSLQETEMLLVWQAEFVRLLLRVWYASELVADYCIQQPSAFLGLKISGDMHRTYTPEEYAQIVSAPLAKVENDTELMSVLRQLRLREMVRIAWRDLLGWSDIDENLRDLSLLAEACIAESLLVIQRINEPKWGRPFTDDGQLVNAVVLGMGKLGARELNFSSDVDLIYTFEAPGETRDGEMSIDNHLYFEKIFKQLTSTLDTMTEEGFVFRVDTRLRPFGESGALVVSFAAFEDYYESYGRDWERYAFIKARVVAGCVQTGERLLMKLRPFVYRRYLDYSAFESLRQMKQLISSEVTRKGMQDNIKLGAGGIREIEFIGQMFQLIRGGRAWEYRCQQIRPILRLLQRDGYLHEEAVTELISGYEFLRKTEHRLQMWRDQQTHQLPVQPQAQEILATTMGFGDWEKFISELQSIRQKVQHHFENIVLMPGGPRAVPSEQSQFTHLWNSIDGVDNQTLINKFTQLGFTSPEETAEMLLQSRHSFWYRTLSSSARSRVDEIMASVFCALTELNNKDITLSRVLKLFEAISGRSVYFALMYEHPQVLKQLIELISASQWITDTLAQQPILLDELIDQRTLFDPLDPEALKQDLDSRFQAVTAQDVEQQIEVLHQFNETHSLRVAATDILGKRPLMKVSDYLTALAEIVLDKVFRLAWNELQQRHGRPTLKSGMQNTGFAVIAYGKLGGLELSYTSDLDLVFLHAGEEEGMTDGELTIDNHLFYSRLARRMLHFLQIRTLSGVLYEVDLRLRPQGNSGFLVSSLEAFKLYQREDAWTWEHQALVRARPVVGDPAVCEWFQSLRAEILCLPRDPAQVATDVVNMRQKMRENLETHRDWEVKHGVGGLVDIEFIVQFLVLAHASDHTELVQFSDNVRILEMAQRVNLLSAEEATFLRDTYLLMRRQLHRSALGVAADASEQKILQESRSRVEKIWHNLLIFVDSTIQ